MQQPPSPYREVRIGLTQAFVWLGFLGALVVLSFLLGLYIGKKSGFEAAKETSLEELARSPIDAPTTVDVGGAEVTASTSPSSADSIYQKLQAATPSTANATEELPTLGKIAGVKDSPIELSVSQDKAAKALIDAASTAAAIVGGSAANQINKKAENVAKAIVDGKEISVGDEAPKIQFATPSPVSTPEMLPTVAEILSSPTPMSTPSPRQSAVVTPASTPMATPSATNTPVNVEVAPQATPIEVVKPSVKATPAQSKTTPTPKSTLNPKVSSIDQSIGKGWYAQVAAPQKMTEAQEIANKLSASGFKAKIERAEVKGEQYYRVVVGPEKSKDEANKLASRLKNSGAVTSTPFVKQMK